MFVCTVIVLLVLLCSADVLFTLVLLSLFEMYSCVTHVDFGAEGVCASVCLL